MRVSQRLIAATVLIALSGALASCGGSLDPTDMLDFLDTKKKLPGERKPVFPEGVPGVEQGVPKDLYKGAQEQQFQQQVQPVAEAPPQEPAARRSRPAGHSSASRAAPAEPARARDTDEGAPVEIKPTPAPKRKRTRITAPQHEEPAPQQQTRQQQPPQQQPSPPQQQPLQQPQPELKPFPAPLPSGSFQR